MSGRSFQGGAASPEATPGFPLPACGERVRVRGSHKGILSARNLTSAQDLGRAALMGWSPWLPLTPALSPSPSGPLRHAYPCGWPEGGGERETRHRSPPSPPTPSKAAERAPVSSSRVGAAGDRLTPFTGVPIGWEGGRLAPTPGSRMVGWRGISWISGRAYWCGTSLHWPWPCWARLRESSPPRPGAWPW